MSDLRVTNLKGRTPGSSPTLPDGVIVTGISTFNNTVNLGSVCSISTSGNSLNINSSDSVSISGYYGGTKLLSQQGSDLVVAGGAGDVELYFVTSSGPNGSEKRLETTANGIAVAGVVTAISGTVTYYGDGSNLTNVGAAQSTRTLQTWLFGGG